MGKSKDEEQVILIGLLIAVDMLVIRENEAIGFLRAKVTQAIQSWNNSRRDSCESEDLIG
jgi:hypothetical protein